MGRGSAEDTGANQERAAANTAALPWKKDARARHQGGTGGLQIAKDCKEAAQL